MFTRADANRHYGGGKKVIFTGKPHSGKDWCANILIEEFGYQKVAFATPVKEAAADLFDWGDPEANKDEWVANAADGTHLTKRDIWRKLAEEFVKPLMGPYHFAKLAAKKIVYMTAEQHVVITDLRFPAEADIFYTVPNTVFIQVVRDDAEAVEGIHDHAVENHDLSKYINHTIRARSGDLDGLRAQLLEVLGLSSSCK